MTNNTVLNIDDDTLHSLMCYNFDTLLYQMCRYHKLISKLKVWLIYVWGYASSSKINTVLLENKKIDQVNIFEIGLKMFYPQPEWPNSGTSSYH